MTGVKTCALPICAHFERAAPILDIAPCDVHRVETLHIASVDGHPVPTRVYLPHEPSWAQPLPVLVFLHGGGFTVGSPDTVDAVARMLCMRAECAVLSVDYRLAPEHKFPRAFDDVYAVMRWAHAEAHAQDRKSTRLNSSHIPLSRMPSSA